MKAVILAGGMGTRIAEESHLRPKPMIEIGGQPILWHILKIFAAHGVQDFIICCGYKGYLIKEYFANYVLHRSDVTFDLAANRVEVHQQQAEPWRVTLVDTGERTGTGGRLKRVAHHLRGERDFCFTYGDGVGDIDITALLAHHRDRGLLATVTAALPPGRFGALDIDEASGQVRAFREKPRADGPAGTMGGAVNAGFFVLQPAVIDLIDGDDTLWEHTPVERLTAAGQLGAYLHQGFWQPMDTLRDRNHLEQLWAQGAAPWKVW
jgi:glucose-1-phosphate cytidylyltransferase